MTETIIECPQCGFSDYDEMEICQACGFLSKDTPVRNISFSQVVNDTRTRLRQMGFHGVDSAAFEEDPMTDPGWSTLTGNFYNRIDEDQSNRECCYPDLSYNTHHED